MSEKKLTKSDLIKTFLLWETQTEVCLSYERLMSLGFCISMSPVIKRLYDTKEERAEAMKRHLVFFNTENNWGAFIPGIVASMEEDRANGAPITDDLINNVKIGLMGEEIMDVNAVKSLAAMPSREVLLARLVGSLNSSISKLVYVLEALRKKQAGEE